jgi:hypothetical protein
MTTGRINQVTIFRPVRGCRLPFGRRGDFDTGERHGDAPPEAPVAWASDAAGGLLLSPPSFIKAPVGRTEPLLRGLVWPGVLLWSA